MHKFLNSSVMVLNAISLVLHLGCVSLLLITTVSSWGQRPFLNQLWSLKKVDKLFFNLVKVKKGK